MSTAYIALGSNLGERQKNLDQAMDFLQEAGIDIIQVSTIIETEPQGGPQQGKYLNSVIKINTSFSPNALLNELMNIEKKMGRVRTIKNGPRIIDLDILIYDDITLVSDRLTIPHPRMLEREFVLKPLTEIEPLILDKNIFHWTKINKHT